MYCIVVSAFAVLAVASLTTAVAPPASECQTPPVECCTTLAPADTPVVAMVLKGLGITPVHPDELAGLTCNPINGTIGPGGDASCPTNFQPVCCGQITSQPSGIDVDCVVVDPQA
ncbi:hypothetical protein BDY19DRAFT_926951 [Irpex rosettiformis]|uniref:Uncharacterized protein n=1 Tax=Irpex rosettiformis TaxID=378272 RepID=A0ACB8UEQ6_9APHY|nr:hypothetical protein BDY19DRAFT_926951 [Irpex rosettiformis]